MRFKEARHRHSAEPSAYLWDHAARAPGESRLPPFRIVLAALAAISTCGYAADGAPLKLTIAIDGAPLEVDLREPGRPAQMSFQAPAGQRLWLGIAGPQLAPASVRGASSVVRHPAPSLRPSTRLFHC